MAVRYCGGLPLAPIKWVLARDPAGTLASKAWHLASTATSFGERAPLQGGRPALPRVAAPVPALIAFVAATVLVPLIQMRRQRHEALPDDEPL
jgi:hypothetical protein